MRFKESLYLENESGIRKVGIRSPVSLDNREKQIINLLWEEKTIKESADILYISVSLVEKIKANSLADTIKHGLKFGVISFSDVDLKNVNQFT